MKNVLKENKNLHLFQRFGRRFEPQFTSIVVTGSYPVLPGKIFEVHEQMLWELDRKAKFRQVPDQNQQHSKK